MVEVLELVGTVLVDMLVVEGTDEVDEALAGLDVEAGAELDVLDMVEVESVVELADEMDVELVDELEEGRPGVEELVELGVALGRLELEEDEDMLDEIELLDEEVDEEEISGKELGRSWFFLRLR